ncbi:MAG: hypothetical protein RIE77_04450 [Phycisphaerales bacterium]|jgi:hypothetical protein
MSSIEEHTVADDTREDAYEDTREDACGDTCEGCSCEEDAIAGRVGVTVEGEPDEVDALTRGLLGSFSRFIETGDDEDENDGHDETHVDVDEAEPTAESSAADHQSAEPAGLPREERPEGAALDEALGRVESAMAALVSAVPSLEERLTGVEAQVQAGVGIGDGVPEGVDRNAVAGRLKDRLADVDRECKRLASVPIERIEARVASAERSLGRLIERAETVLGACEAQREAAEGVADRLTELAAALEPWTELLDLRENEDGMPKPLAALLRIAGAELSREMAGVRGSLEQFAGVLDLSGTEPEIEQIEATNGGGVQEGDIVAPQGPGEDGSRKRSRRKNGKSRAVRVKGADAETPRRGASDRRLSAEARLRARSRAEGRPPRR